jgi:hypothetical protein
MSRVNARLDEASQQQLEYLTSATGQGVSDVVREAIKVYHAQVVQARKPGPSRFLALAGTGRSGRSDIASNIKAYVAEAIEAKHTR